MKNGFSLVELSIVLVVLGLLTGGILSGQSLIRASELRSVTSELAVYHTGVMAFQDQYMGLPGDIADATSYWGAMTNCGAASPSGSGTQTCNGNANGQLQAAGAASQTGEMYGFWQQLANAGLVDGTYSGIAGSGDTQHAIIGTNVAKSKLANGGWTTTWVGDQSAASAWAFAGSYGHAMHFGAQGPTNATQYPLITPKEAWNIDSKIDDGQPETGAVRGREDLAGAGLTSCSNTTTQAYILQNTNKHCALIFADVF